MHGAAPYSDGAVQGGLSHGKGLPAVPGPVKPGAGTGADDLRQENLSPSYDPHYPHLSQARANKTPKPCAPGEIVFIQASIR